MEEEKSGGHEEARKLERAIKLDEEMKELLRLAIIQNKMLRNIKDKVDAITNEREPNIEDYPELLASEKEMEGCIKAMKELEKRGKEIEEEARKLNYNGKIWKP